MTVKTQMEKLFEVRALLADKPYFFLTYPGSFVLYRKGEVGSMRSSIVARCGTADKLLAKVKHMLKEPKK